MDSRQDLAAADILVKRNPFSAALLYCRNSAAMCMLKQCCRFHRQSCLYRRSPLMSLSRDRITLVLMDTTPARLSMVSAIKPSISF